MTLQIAPGFNVSIPGTELFFEPPADGRLLNAADVPQLLNNPASWLYHATQSEPLALTENDLTLQTVGNLTLEFLTSVAVLAFNVTASSVKPVKAMGRVVLIDYTPWQRKDPPVPLLDMLGLPRRALAMHNAAIHLMLTQNDASAIRPAMSAVLQSCASRERSRSSGVETRMRAAEAFYYVARMLSLVTGAYTQSF